MKALIQDLGRRTYPEALSIQLSTQERVLEGQPHTLLLVEHEPVLTLGANFHAENLKLTEAEYRERGIAVERTGRGGDVTFHGPGQLVIYPIFNVAELGKDLHRWLRDLEQTILLLLEKLGLSGRRFPPHTGVWIENQKVAAIGIKVSRWVSIHGIAVNCDNDLAPFNLIVPCGIMDYGVTSLTKALGRRVTVEEVKPLIIECFAEVFDLTFSEIAL